MNEAEFQANLVGRIRAALPLLAPEITLERYLHLRLGHHAVVIDGFASDKAAVQGRYDVLVIANGKPLIVAELKAPGIDLEPDDIAQGLSYARLHEPMVPIVMVTNGAQTLIRRTYDSAQLGASDVSAEQLDATLSAAAAVAASDSQQAVRTLLGASATTWAQVFRAWSNEAIAAITGDVRDFKAPVVRGFVIPRTVAQRISDLLRLGERVVVVHGPPLSGITNVLVQATTDSTSKPTLFIEARAAEDILQFIANRLARELSVSISKDDVRAWLNTRKGLADLTLVLDGIPETGTDELVENAVAGLLQLVIGVGSETFTRIASIPGRAQISPLGRAAVPIKVEPLSDAEFNDALTVFDTTYRACFLNGVQHSVRLRWPRALRVTAASLPAPTNPPASDPGHAERRLLLPPIPGPESLGASRSAFVHDPALQYDLRLLAKAYLNDAEQHLGDAGWLSSTWGQPSVDPSIIEATLGAARLERLSLEGVVAWVETRGLGPRILVRVEELLAHYVAEQWAEALARQKEDGALAEEIERLLQLCAVIPAGEVAVAAALLRAWRDNDAVMNVAIPELIRREPSTSRAKEGADLELLIKGSPPIRLHFGSGMDEELVGNLHPWLVLSHIASIPLAVVDQKQTANLDIFARLGVSRHLLYQPPPVEVAHMQPLHVHEIDGVGSILCLKTGIVEPLLQSMWHHAHSHPDELVRLASFAVDEKEAHLAWRVLTVALASQSSTDQNVARLATQVSEVVREWWGKALDDALRSRT